MTQTYSRSRQQAEIAFAKAQSQFLTRKPTVEAPDFIVQTRAENTARLRKARLARDLAERESAAPTIISKRANSA